MAILFGLIGFALLCYPLKLTWDLSSGIAERITQKPGNEYLSVAIFSSLMIAIAGLMWIIDPRRTGDSAGSLLTIPEWVILYCLGCLALVIVGYSVYGLISAAKYLFGARRT